MDKLVDAVKHPCIRPDDEYILTIENRYLDVAKYDVDDFKRYLKKAAGIEEQNVECKYIFFTHEKQHLDFIVLLKTVESHRNVMVKGCFIKSESFIKKVVDLDKEVSDEDLNDVIIPYFSYGGYTFYRYLMIDTSKFIPTFQFDRVVFGGKYNEFNNPYMNCYDAVMEEGPKHLCILAMR